MSWIKMRSDLDTDPAVIQLAEHYGWKEHVIVGLLHKLWVWADRQTTDGVIPGVSANFINRYLDVSDFAQQLEKVGWLEIQGEGAIAGADAQNAGAKCASAGAKTRAKSAIVFPNYDTHMSKSAKNRAKTARRVKRHRDSKGRIVTKALLDKRREDKSKKETYVRNAPDFAQPTETCVPEETRKTATLEVDARFSDFWKAYPPRKGVKRGKQKARQIFGALSVRDQVRTVGAATNYQREEFIRDAERFLRDGYWKDFVEKPPDENESRVATLAEAEDLFSP